MKKLLILAVTGGALLMAAPAQADASSYLPTWKAKQAARSDARAIASPDPVTYLSCWRTSRSRVVCEWESESYEGIVCGATYAYRKVSWMSRPLWSIVRSVDCW